jgi:general stress protein 26
VAGRLRRGELPRSHTSEEVDARPIGGFLAGPASRRGGTVPEIDRGMTTLAATPTFLPAVSPSASATAEGRDHTRPASNPLVGTEALSSKQKHVYEILNDFTTVMVITFDAESSSSNLHARPMNIARLDPDGTLWFVTAIDSPKIDEAESPPVGHVVAQSSARYLSIAGMFSVTRERAALERVWSKANEVWFPEGLDDPRVCLLGFHPTHAEFWDVSGTKGLSFAYEAAKALLTGKAIENQDDPEQHGEVRMA